MSIFNKPKTDIEKLDDLHRKYGLDIDNYDEAQIKAENGKNLRQVADDLSQMGLNRLGMNLTMSRQDLSKIGYLSAIFQTNLILIRQNELIIRALDKITKNK